ncbi:MAG: septation protein IspZ, partial [Gammaproteobacteria bacterium]|nr:septation protein IspZ [Gammaproteobacteria bacterium]
MKLLTDFLPIVIFFVAYKLYGIFTATGAAIVVSVLLVSWAWYKYRKVDNTQWITLGAIVILGGATLIFHKAIYIQWKVSIVYWALALAFLLSQFIGKASYY